MNSTCRKCFSITLGQFTLAGEKEKRECSHAPAKTLALASLKVIGRAGVPFDVQGDDGLSSDSPSFQWSIFRCDDDPRSSGWKPETPKGQRYFKIQSGLQNGVRHRRYFELPMQCVRMSVEAAQYHEREQERSIGSGEYYPKARSFYLVLELSARVTPLMMRGFVRARPQPWMLRHGQDYTTPRAQRPMHGSQNRFVILYMFENI